MISVISACVLFTVRSIGCSSWFIQPPPIFFSPLYLRLDTIRESGRFDKKSPQALVPVWAIPAHFANPPVRMNPKFGPDASKMDKIKRLQEILSLDPKNSFARYGIAMELASQGDTAAALAEFDLLLSNDP